MSFEQQLIALIPQLRAFARVLLRGRGEADDLVQDSVLRMWQARERFEAGTNMRAWAFTILRNRFYNAYTNRHAAVPLEDAPDTAIAMPAMQERIVAGRDIRAALAALDPLLRETLALTVGSGMSYEEVASIVGCPVGTVKSRVFRARRRLRALLGETAGDFARRGQDRERSNSLEAMVQEWA